jgi:hypothetical protein
VLKAGEEGAHLRQRSAARGFQLLHSGNPVGELTLEIEGWERDSQFLDDLHVQSWHYGTAFFNAKPVLNFWMQKEACVQVDWKAT